MKHIITNLTKSTIVVNNFSTGPAMPPAIGFKSIDLTIPASVDGAEPSTVLVDSGDNGVHPSLLGLQRDGYIEINEAQPLPPPAPKTTQQPSRPTGPTARGSKSKKKVAQEQGNAVVAVGRGQPVVAKTTHSIAEDATALMPPGHPAHAAAAAPEPPVSEAQKEYSDAFIDVKTGQPINPRS